MNKLLSKSKYLAGLQCPSLLCVKINDKASIPAPDETAKHRFEEGYLVEKQAKKLFPGAVVLPEGFIENLTATKEALEQRKPLLEAAIKINNLYSRTDILNPVGAGKWDIIEVKSGTKVKDVNLHDVSFQRHCWELAGLRIRKCFVMHVDNSYVRKGAIDPKKLMMQVDITDKVSEVSEGISERIDDMFKVINADRPKSKLGQHCKNPYDCPLKAECWGELPKNSVTQLYRGGKKCFELLDRGIMIMPEIPSDFKLTVNQEVQHWCAMNKQTHLNVNGLKKFLGRLKYPLYYLDFETFNSALPLFDGVKPYQQIPFQFSLHIVQEDGSIEHISFLHEGKSDPRPKFMKALKKVLGSEGSIVVYNESFEKRILKEGAEELKEYSEWVDSLIPRFVDLIVPFKKFWYYDCSQKGSASLKKVLPAVTGKSYEGLEIDNGGLASLSFAKVTYGSVSDAVRLKVRKDLEKYCCLDTEGMIWIVDALKELVSCC